MLSRVRLESLKVMRAEVVGRMELKVAGEAGAERRLRCRVNRVNGVLDRGCHQPGREQNV